MKLKQSRDYSAITLDTIISQLTKKYDPLLFYEIDGQFFICKTLTRKEYRAIINSPRLNDYDKVDEVCKTCILYPEGFDLDNCDCGLPDELFKRIYEDSCLSAESMIMLLEMNREEMTLLESQMGCMILDAFPSYKLKDLEEMNMIEFIKLYSRAEWTMENLQDKSLAVDILDVMQKQDPQYVSQEENEEEVVQEQYETPSSPKSETNNNKTKMTPEQLRQYEEFCRKHPEFDMSTDYAFTNNLGQTFHKDNPALRPGWGITGERRRN